MSEFTTKDPGVATLLDNFGLDITSKKAVTVTTPERPKPRTPAGTVLVEGSDVKDKISASGKFEYTIEGREGKDTIEGGKRDDVIIGGADKDVTVGGKGDDSFVFNNGDLVESGKTNKLDTIEGFEKGDMILIDKKIVDKNLKKGVLEDNDIAIVKKNKGNLDETLIFVKSEGVLYYNDDEGTKDTGLMNIEGKTPKVDNFEIF